MTNKAKEEPLILRLDRLLPPGEYIERKAARLAKEILERKGEKT